MSLKREYSGPPIDMTEQYIGERPNQGETVSGTSEDDFFSQHTDWLPSGVDEDDFTEKQKEAIRAYLSYTDRESVTMGELAAGKDFSKETARRAIHKAFRDVRGFDDLTDSTKLGVLIWAHEGMDASQKQLAEEYPISSRALGESKRVYPDLIEEQQPIGVEEIEDAVEQYKQAHPQSRKSDSSSKSTSTGKYQKAKSEKEYPDDFSETYQWFIETIAENPEKSTTEIAELIPEEKGYSPQNYYNVIRDYGHIVKSRIEEKGTAESEDDLSEYLASRIELDVQTGDDDGDDSPSKQDGGSESDGVLDQRLRAVESKVDSLRQEVEGMDAQAPEAATNGSNNDLAGMIIQSMSDEQLGSIIRGAMNDE